jgi:hypothetical protein
MRKTILPADDLRCLRRRLNCPFCRRCREPGPSWSGTASGDRGTTRSPSRPNASRLERVRWRGRGVIAAIGWQTTNSSSRRNVGFAPIVLKKSFLDDERNFLGPLMRSARVDVRDDHRPSYRRYRAFQRHKRLRINCSEILGVVRFFDFCNSIRQKRPFND